VEKNVPIAGSISEFVPSPNGKKLQLFLEAKFLLLPMVEVPKNHQHTRRAPRAMVTRQ
jgi:hypothetical protein